eukprot:SAG11_NODE_5111_length_1660_cov_1.500961_1_plen_181_part_00
METGNKEGVLDPHGNFAMSVACSPDNKLVAAGDVSGHVTVFDLQSASPVMKLEGHAMSVRALAFSADSSTLLTGSDDKQIHLYDVKNGGSGTAVASLGGHSSWVLGLAHSPNPGSSAFTSCSSDGKVKFWDLRRREDIHTSDAHGDQVWSVAYNASGTRLVSASEDKSIIVHDVTGDVSE